MEKNKIYLALKKFCVDNGADLFGVADIKNIKGEFRLLAQNLKDADKAVCLGARLSGGVLGEIEATPNYLYFHNYRTANIFLDQLAFKVCNFIQRRDFFALPIPASQVLDWNKQNAHLSHKKLGALAGLGWIGRNNLLVNKKFGSCFRLVSILTDLPVDTDKPLKQDCGECRRCIKVCPAGAIKENPSEFDHIKCFEKLKEFQRRRLAEQFICGVCIKACKGEKYA